MPSDNKIVFPRRGYQKLNAGQNSKFDSQLIADNELAAAVNVIFGTDSVETRGGTAKVNTSSVGTFSCDGIYTRHNRDTSQTMCAWFGGSLYNLGVTTLTTVPSAQSVFTMGNRVCGVEYENHIFFGNGSDTPYKWNGTDFTRHGVYPPQSAPTAASGATGSLSGLYSWKVTYLNSASAEGDVSSASAAITITAGEAAVTIPIAPASYGCASRYLYRTTDGGSEYKFVKLINDNTTSITTDTIADGSLGVTAPSDNGVPPVYSAMTYHKDRLWTNDASYPNLVWYSETGEPYTFGSTNYISVGDDTADLVTGLTVLNDCILIFCSASIWLIYLPDDTPANWQKVRVNSPYGCKSPHGFFQYNDKVMFPAVQNHKFVGFAAVRGAGIEYDTALLTTSSMKSDLKSNRIEPDCFEVQEGYLKDISAYVHKNKAYISVPYGSGLTYNNKIFIWDFSLGDMARTQKLQEGFWSIWEGLSAEQFTEYSGNLYYAPSTATGHVYIMNQSTYSDDGTAIDSYIWTKEFSGNPGDEEYHKDFRKYEVLYYRGGSYYMDLYYRTDSDTGDGIRKQIDCTPQTTLWDVARWDIDQWSKGSTEAEEIASLGQSRGKRIQFKISNQNKAGQYFKILGLKFFYVKKGKR